MYVAHLFEIAILKDHLLNINYLKCIATVHENKFIFRIMFSILNGK